MASIPIAEEKHSHYCIDEITTWILDTVIEIESMWRERKLKCESVKDIKIKGLTLFEISELLDEIRDKTKELKA